MRIRCLEAASAVASLPATSHLEALLLDQVCWGQLSVPSSQRIAAAVQKDFAAAGVKAPLGVARFASIGATGRLKNNMRKDLFKHKLAPLVMRDALCSIRLWIKSRALRLHLLTLLYSSHLHDNDKQTNQQILASLMAR